jgi:hypothetical protein
VTRTPVEKAIIADRVQAQGVLVPKLNELLKYGVGIEDPADVEFINTLTMKQVVREKERRTGQAVYSPSGLASCLRRVYLSRHWKELGLTRVELPAIQPHFYFLTGDFIHLKWQFAMWRLSIMELTKAAENPGYEPAFVLLDCEINVQSKHGDHGGTIDVLCLIDGELVIVDIKGLNVRGFQKVDANEIQDTYRVQVGDYIMLWNSGVRHRLKKVPTHITELTGWTEFPKVTKGIILAENKGGPDPKHPAALTEYIVKSKDAIPEVRARLGVLRAHEEEKTIPAAECRSTRGIQFEGCPFAEYCRKEIRSLEKRDRKAADRNPREYRVSQPSRTRGAG